MTDELIQLTGREQLVLAALARVMLHQDGRTSDQELRAVDWIGGVVAESAEVGVGGPYRTGAALEPLGHARMRELVGHSVEAFPTDDDVARAAESIEDPEVRAVIHALLFELAAVNTIHPSEWHVLEWLAERWGLEPS